MGFCYFYTACRIIAKISKLYAKDLLEDQTELNAFFKKMDTPVDVEKEVMVEGAKEVNVFPLVGGVSILIGLLSLLLLINPQARANVFVNVSITGLLVVIGLLMLFSNKIQKSLQNKKSCGYLNSGEVMNNV